MSLCSTLNCFILFCTPVHCHVYFLQLIYSPFSLVFILAFRYSVLFRMLQPSFSSSSLLRLLLLSHARVLQQHLPADVEIMSNHCPALSCLGAAINEILSVHQPLDHRPLLVDLESCFMVNSKLLL